MGAIIVFGWSFFACLGILGWLNSKEVAKGSGAGPDLLLVLSFLAGAFCALIWTTFRWLIA
jgi:hypothetical protein